MSSVSGGARYLLFRSLSELFVLARRQLFCVAFYVRLMRRKSKALLAELCLVSQVPRNFVCPYILDSWYLIAAVSERFSLYQKTYDQSEMNWRKIQTSRNWQDVKASVKSCQIMLLCQALSTAIRAHVVGIALPEMVQNLTWAFSRELCAKLDVAYAHQTWC